MTDEQIKQARRHRPTPQKKAHYSTHPLVDTPTRHNQEHWLKESPSHRHITFRHLPRLIPNIFKGYREQAIHTGFKLVGYSRRVSKRKGFSDDPDVMAEREAFTRIGITQSRERLYRQIFSDEVWTIRGAFTQEYVTVKEDGSDRYDYDCLQYKYRKRPAQMFYSTIVFRGKQNSSRF